MPQYKLLFDQRPKDNRRDLYDMEAQLQALLQALQQGAPLVTIVGLRRTGKTSVLLTACNELPSPSVIVDLRVLAGKPYATKRDLVEALGQAFNALYGARGRVRHKLFQWLRRVRGVSVSASGMSLSWGGKEPLDLAALFDELNAWALQERQRVVLAFDEAQELRKVAGVNMARLLAHVYDYCRALSVVLTGSAVGLLYEFIGADDPKAPLYGRHIQEVRLGPLPAHLARNFLVRGLRQAKLQVDPTIVARAVARLDGIAGWLTLFGVTCMQAGVSEQVIEQTIETGKRLAKQEFGHFLKGREVARRRYETMVRHLARGPASWAGVKRAVEGAEGKAVNDRNVTELLTTLVKAGFVERKDALYGVADPMLTAAFR